MVLRGRYPAMIRRRDLLGCLANVRRAHFQPLGHGRRDVVGLLGGDYAFAHALDLLDETLDAQVGEIGRVGRVESALVVMAAA
jgi:hypothetical protein